MATSTNSDGIMSSRMWAERLGVEMPKGFLTDPRRWELISRADFEKRVEGGFYR